MDVVGKEKEHQEVTGMLLDCALRRIKTTGRRENQERF
jgi:hypothetical protein